MFKDYEYGFYGFIGSFSGKWMDTGKVHEYEHLNYTCGHRSDYTFRLRHNMKQLPKIQSVVFIYGDYKECI